MQTCDLPSWTEARPAPRRGFRHHRLGRLAALAVGEAVLVELPLAAAAIWLAVALTRDTGRGRPEHARYREPARSQDLDRAIRNAPR